MAFVGADIPFVGGSYEAPMVLQDAQRLINWYTEMSASGNPKQALALLGCPGLNPVASTQTGAVRGFWTLPGGTTALAVTGNMLYLLTITVPATQSSIAQFSVTTIGTLLTNNGPVVMRDNGVLFGGFGGYVLMVDGVYCYYYRIAGAGTYVFTGGTTIASTTVTVPGVLPSGLLIGAGVTIADSGLAIPYTANIA